MKTLSSIFICCFLLVATVVSAQQFEKDSFVTKRGQLDITFVGHSSLLLTYNGSYVYIDPVSTYADYSTLPKADVILITHEHADHFDPKAIADLKKESTILVLNLATQHKLGEGIAMKNGDAQQLTPYLYIEAVPAYNHGAESAVKEPREERIEVSLIDETNLIFLEDEKSEKKKGKRKPNDDKREMHTKPPVNRHGAALYGEQSPPHREEEPIPIPIKYAAPKKEIYHPRYRDNGYVLAIDDKRIYIAGDTEDILEMMELDEIDIAFLPVNQPYTMTPKQAANAARMFNPTILYPYHYGATRIEELQNLLQYDKHIEVRIKQLQ
ncbi:MAG: MBL fold metallo-hydrolase [Prevotellaceae bacterium]|jgi:L-ascorbate metabolism protein UlaG (beta-lactamase superfamily)|nr:MBL fold metallo-hydrolase [Prevotellaceae bacterium]